MSEMASLITSVSVVCSTVGSGADQRKHQSSLSMAFVREIHRWLMDSPRKWPVTRKIFPFDYVIMSMGSFSLWMSLTKYIQSQMSDASTEGTYDVKLLIYFQTAMVAPLKIGNEERISSHNIHWLSDAFFKSNIKSLALIETVPALSDYYQHLVGGWAWTALWLFSHAGGKINPYLKPIRNIRY